MHRCRHHRSSVRLHGYTHCIAYGHAGANGRYDSHSDGFSDAERHADTDAQCDADGHAECDGSPHADAGAV